MFFVKLEPCVVGMEAWVLILTPPGLQGDVDVIFDEGLVAGLYSACCRPSLRALM